MPLPTPNLDDRRFQNFVDEAKRLIPRYCPEWTDHNVSDPGVTLIELFAWMVEALIYRLNRVPEKSYITFMELMGIHLQPPTAARTDLTFWLSAPASGPVSIPAGTEVTTVQTGTERAVSFSTDRELLLHPAQLRICLTAPEEGAATDQTWKLDVESEHVSAFQPFPRPGDAFYLGYAVDISGHTLEVRIDCSIEGLGVDPTNPPLVWEAQTAQGWTPIDLKSDSTAGLNRPGEVVMFLPHQIDRRELHGHSAYWLRCRHIAPLAGQPTYSASPRIATMRSATVGGTVGATHAVPVTGEVLGRSDGSPGQIFRLEYPPVLPRHDDEHIEVQEEDGSWTAWRECAHFGQSQGDQRHVTLDSVSGELRFGPSIREPDGSDHQYGAIPPRGRPVRFSRYRNGGGTVGNVGAGKLTVLRHSVPYVDNVINRRAASGGSDAETLERAALRAPQVLRSSARAVTAEDFAHLAREAVPGIRAHCVQPGAIDNPDSPAPGEVVLLVVPPLPQPEHTLSPADLELAPLLVQTLREYLDDRRTLTARLAIRPPGYRWVSVEAHVNVWGDADADAVRQEVLLRLHRLLHPHAGGRAGQGWEFGSDLHVSDLYAVLQGVPGVAYLEQISLRADNDPHPYTRIHVPPNGLVASGSHHIQIQVVER
ncbi:MAG TPA: putative baseplate assembly protein [Roseiflexaceae bacterium]|nr:putative baseplate assembly protein [Roseiflexaceae bacterium]